MTALLLANELGGGRGHVAKFARLARALGAEVAPLAALGSLRHAAELQAAGVEVARSPKMGFLPAVKADPAAGGNATWACYLAACGFADEALVARNLAFWRGLIVQRNISVLIADYAPLALLAARGLQAEGWEIRTIALGTGYAVPPAGMAEFPRLLPDWARVVQPEAVTLAAVNRAAAAQGIAPLPALPALMRCDLALPATHDFLDPYAPWRDGACVPPLAQAEAAGTGEEIFVYFSRREAEAPGPLFEALCRLDLPRRGYLPMASDATREALRAAGMMVETTPVSPAEIAARSRMVLHSAPHGTLTMAALAGLPQLALPQHHEQETHARLARDAGILHLLPRGAGAAGILAAVETVYHDAALRRRAADLGRALRAGFPADPLADLAARLAPELAAARAFATA